jgi:hypothetical protein
MEVDIEQGVVHFFFNGVRQGSEGFVLARCEGAVRITKARKRGPLPSRSPFPYVVRPWSADSKVVVCVCGGACAVVRVRVARPNPCGAAEAARSRPLKVEPRAVALPWPASTSALGHGINGASFCRNQTRVTWVKGGRVSSLANEQLATPQSRHKKLFLY